MTYNNGFVGNYVTPQVAERTLDINVNNLYPYQPPVRFEALGSFGSQSFFLF